jgi:hypothetical protein
MLRGLEFVSVKWSHPGAPERKRAAEERLRWAEIVGVLQTPLMVFRIVKMVKIIHTIEVSSNNVDKS